MQQSKYMQAEGQRPKPASVMLTHTPGVVVSIETSIALLSSQEDWLFST